MSRSPIVIKGRSIVSIVGTLRCSRKTVPDHIELLKSSILLTNTYFDDRAVALEYCIHAGSCMDWSPASFVTCIFIVFLYFVFQNISIFKLSN